MKRATTFGLLAGALFAGLVGLPGSALAGHRDDGHSAYTLAYHRSYSEHRPYYWRPYPPPRYRHHYRHHDHDHHHVHVHGPFCGHSYVYRDYGNDYGRSGITFSYSYYD